MAAKTKKFAMTFAIIIAMVLTGGIFVTSDDAFAGGAIFVRPGFDDRIVVTRPFFNPFLLDDDFFFGFEEEENDDFFFERRPFFGGFERDDDERPFFGGFERDD